jgi:peptide/nickel transport system permease protein
MHYVVLRRILLTIPLMLAVVVVTFGLIHLAPGDPAYLLAGDAPTPEFLAQVRAEYGLDQPLGTQLLTYLGKAAQLDFGTSIYFKRPVFTVIFARVPATLLLTLCALALASVGGVLLGVTAARHRGTRIDGLLSAVSLVGYSIPTFWLGQLLVLVFAMSLNWLPTGGFTSTRITYTGLDYGIDVAKHLVLPVISLALFELGLIARFTRTAMIEALDRDYVTVAYAKGADTGRVLWRHALPNALLTTVTVIGLEFGVLLAGALVTETIFGWPGLGTLFYDAVFRRDFPLLTGCFIFAASAVIIANLLTDLVYAALDPRVRR